MSAGRIECVSAASGFTVNQEYDVFGFVYVSGGGVSVVTVNDNGEFVHADPNSTVFQVTELYAGRKVV